MAAIRIEVEVDADGAIKEIHALDASGQRMGASLERAGKRGNVVMTQMRREMLEARQASQLLSQTLGVQVPRAIEQIILKSKAMRTALSSAFSTVAVAGFVVFAAQAMAQLAEQVIAWWHKVEDERNRIMAEAGMKGMNAEIAIRQRQIALELAIASRGATAEQKLRLEAAAAIRQRRSELDLAGLLGDVRVTREFARETKLIWANAYGEIARQRGEALRQFEAKAAQILVEPGVAKLTLDYTRQVEALQELARQTGMTARVKELLRLEVAKLTDEFNKQVEALGTVVVQLERVRPTLMRPGERAPFVPSENDIALLEQAREAVAQLQLSQLEGIPRILAERDREIAKIQELMEQHRQFADLVAELEKQKELVIMDANRRIAEEQRRQVEELATQMENFVGRLTDNFTSFKNFWKNLWSELKRFFIRQLFEMLAQWILFGKQMQGASAGAGAGGIGAVLGGIFGLPTSPGVITNFTSQSTGVATGTGGEPGGGGGGSASNISGLEKILKRFGITLHGGQFGPLLASGGALALLAGLQAGGPVSGGILGGLGGAALGFALGGPLGAFIGGLGGAAAGGLAGLFSRGKTRRRAAESQELFAAQLTQIRKEYFEFQLAYEAALGGIDQLWADFSSVMPQKFGKYGRRSVRFMGPIVAEIRKQIEDTEKIRAQRGALIGSLPIPEFLSGGFTNDAFRQILSGQGKMLAWLHRDEAVLNPRAVQRLGPALIEQANSFQGGGFVGSRPGAQGGDTFVVNNLIVPGPGMDSEQLAAMATRKTMQALRRGLADRGKRL